MNKKLQERLDSLSPTKRALIEAELGKRYVNDRTDAEVNWRNVRPLEFSLLFFSSEGASDKADKYELLMRSAKFADRNGFSAIWTPERHFKPFGGLFPNPSVVSAALAMVTDRIGLRGGSVVLPLQDPLRVAEEWAVVDNLSEGRVGVAFASGWLPDDFVLAPDVYSSRKIRTFQDVDVVRSLWAGELISRKNGVGKEIPVRIYPRPLQPELPTWITATHRETFVRAGEIGANVITGLMEQDLDTCASSIAAYREARLSAGHSPEDGCVTLMLHTYLGDDDRAVKELVRQPLCSYLESFRSMAIHGEKASHDEHQRGSPTDDHAALLELLFERYYRSAALLGTPDGCRTFIGKLVTIGVTEIACLVDFGLPVDDVLCGLERLNTLRKWCMSRVA